MPTLAVPDLASLSKAELERHKEVQRLYAEFHRRNGAMMQELLLDAKKIYWAGDILRDTFSEEETRFVNTATGHELHVEEELKNVYHKAVYIVDEAEPYREVIERLKGLQSRVMMLTGASVPYVGLLEPHLFEDVSLARLRCQHVNKDRKVLPKTYAAELEGKLEQLKDTARKFEQVSLEDDATKRVHKEIEQLQDIIRNVGLETERILVRTRTLVVMPYLYRQGEAQRVYLRDEGLILVGNPDVEIGRARLRRSDLVTKDKLEPLAAFENVEVYRLEEWKEVVGKKK